MQMRGLGREAEAEQSRVALPFDPHLAGGTGRIAGRSS
jgi:hypothetical protein